jgi:hypothetical protein
MVYGVGINDSTYQVSIKDNGKEVWRCPYYKQWKNMLARCYSKAYHKQDSKRVGSSVDPRWHLFSDFKQWMETQDWKGNQLDKDLLVIGNMNYSPDICLFVSRQVNSFITQRPSSSGIRGVYPTLNGNWQASVPLYGETNNRITAVFKTKEEASVAIKDMRAQSIKSLAAIQTDIRIRDALLNLAN